ncbi:MAG: aminoglycoside phosphotransferase family protein, partial [Acidobacteria bacterium]|nr:aminoglycoside phosphotransferase family protein [Acidobacteriota bacterium]
MIELSIENAACYLNTAGMGSGPWRVTVLGGGISNTVLLVESGSCRFVLKQALGKLRVEQDWFSDRRRILRESRAMRALKPHFPPGAVPEILFEDRTNLIFAMSAAPEDAKTWKELLLAGEVDFEVAEQAGRMLASMVRISWKRPEWEEAYGDQTVFEQLRLDPYYRTTASRHPELGAHFTRLIEESRARRVSLVHGDWSPKNFLVSQGAMLAIDFEVIHFGDPAFDSAFLLNHLL